MRADMKNNNFIDWICVIFIACLIMTVVLGTFHARLNSINDEIQAQLEINHDYLVDINFHTDVVLARVKLGEKYLAKKIDAIKEEDLLFIEMQLDTILHDHRTLWANVMEQLEIITENTRQKTFDELMDEAMGITEEIELVTPDLTLETMKQLLDDLVIFTGYNINTVKGEMGR